MMARLVDTREAVLEFMNRPENSANTVQAGDHYDIKPRMIYVGIYDGDLLTGIHEFRQFWQNVVECHCTYAPGYRGRWALNGQREFCKWLLPRNPFTNSVTMVPDTAPHASRILTALGATRIGRMEAAYFWNGQPMAVTLYQLTREQHEGIANDF